MRWLHRMTNSMDMNLSKRQEIVKDRKPGMLQSTGLQRVGHDLATEQQQGGKINIVSQKLREESELFFDQLGQKQL